MRRVKCLQTSQYFQMLEETPVGAEGVVLIPYADKHTQMAASSHDWSP